jgi:hypothetical protein
MENRRSEGWVSPFRRFTGSFVDKKGGSRGEIKMKKGVVATEIVSSKQ